MKKLSNKFILGYKDRMTQIFDESGKVIPVTAINIEKNVIVQIRNQEKDGYESLQVATGEQKESRVSKALRGHFRTGVFKDVKEFIVKDISKFKVGDEININNIKEIFDIGDKIQITSISKGKGFQGGVKRWNMAGGRRSHGNKHAEREVGSIGAGTTPGRVWKGKKMPGRMGSDRITVKNLKIVKIDLENSRILIKGAMAGKPGTLVEIRS